MPDVPVEGALTELLVLLTSVTPAPVASSPCGGTAVVGAIAGTAGRRGSAANGRDVSGNVGKAVCVLEGGIGDLGCILLRRIASRGDDGGILGWRQDGRLLLQDGGAAECRPLSDKP